MNTPTGPAVSLLVPVFNRADLLGPCLDSALAQTMDDLEVVVVDGASTDGTWDVCRSFAARDHRVRAFRDPVNTGPVRGWWRCVEEARGTYATFLWSDDMLMPRFLERVLPNLSDEGTAFAYTAAEIGPMPGAGRTAFALRRSAQISGDQFIVGSLKTRGRFPLSPACALFRLRDLERNFRTTLPEPPTDLTSTGAGVDLMLMLLTASQRPRVAHIPEPLAFFRAHGESISVDGRGGEVDRHYALTKIWFARQYGRPDLIPTIVAWHWLAMMRRARRIIAPSAAAKRYGSRVSPFAVVATAVRILASLVLNRLGLRTGPNPS